MRNTVIQKRGVAFGGLTCALILLVLSLSACELLAGDFLDSNFTFEQALNFVGVPLPSTASNVYYESGGFQDAIVWLRFDAPPTDVETFLSAIGFVEYLRELTTYTPSLDADWWTPDAVTEGLSGSLERYEINRFYRVVVDQSNIEMWTVFLIVYNT